MEQKCAVLAGSCGSVESWYSLAVTGSSDRLNWSYLQRRQRAVFRTTATGRLGRDDAISHQRNSNRALLSSLSHAYAWACPCRCKGGSIQRHSKTPRIVRKVTTHLRQVGRVRCNLVRNDAGLDVVPVGQPEVLFRRDVAKECRALTHKGKGGKKSVRPQREGANELPSSPRAPMVAAPMADVMWS